MSTTSPTSPTSPLPPSGEQYRVAHGPFVAVATASGGTLRALTHDGRPLVDGFEEHEQAPGGRGQQLVPWPNRLRDGRYRFGGRDLQLPLGEPALRNASHGLVRWTTWWPVEHTASAVTLGYRLAAQSGYPWTLDLTVRYELSDDGLRVTQSATNRAADAAPYACGAHPYLVAGPGPVDRWLLTLPADTRTLVDERLLPVADEDVTGTVHDFRAPRPVGDLALNDGYTDLHRDDDGVVVVTLTDPDDGRGVALWGDASVRWLQVFTGDGGPVRPRGSLAVEPMTAGADTLRSGRDLVVLEPGATTSVTWGVRPVGVAAAGEPVGEHA